MSKRLKISENHRKPLKVGYVDRFSPKKLLIDSQLSKSLFSSLNHLSKLSFHPPTPPENQFLAFIRSLVTLLRASTLLPRTQKLRQKPIKNCF
jgi:hypothetical protein